MHWRRDAAETRVLNVNNSGREGLASGGYFWMNVQDIEGMSVDAVCNIWTVNFVDLRRVCIYSFAALNKIWNAHYIAREIF